MEPNKTFIIKHKTTGELFRAHSGKTSWKAPGHAKNAFNQSIFKWNYEQMGLELVPETNRYRQGDYRPPLFSEQNVYEVVELRLETETKLDEAKNLLRECLGRCDYHLNKKIQDFLEG